MTFSLIVFLLFLFPSSVIQVKNSLFYLSSHLCNRPNNYFNWMLHTRLIISKSNTVGPLKCSKNWACFSDSCFHQCHFCIWFACFPNTEGAFCQNISFYPSVSFCLSFQMVVPLPDMSLLAPVQDKSELPKYGNQMCFRYCGVLSLSRAITQIITNMHCEKYIRYCLLSRHNINSILFSVSSKYIVL